MPNYTFRDKTTGEVFDVQMKISERDQYVSDNPHLEQIIRKINFADPLLLGRKKVDSAFSERLQDIKESHPGSTINTGNIGDM